MRIISGKYKGRTFNPSKLKFTRPTTDFAREGLFNVLRNYVDISGIHVLDLFSGTGAVAFEFLSRNAAAATSVDSDAQSVKFIAAQAGKWGIENLRVLKSDAVQFIRKNRNQFDLVFADPPFEFKDHRILLDLILQDKAIAPNGCLILEHDKNKDFSDRKEFQIKREFGKVNFSFFSVA